MDSNYFTPTCNLGVAQVKFALLNSQDSAKYLSSISKAEPENIAAIKLLGNVLLLNGESAKAREILKGAIERTPYQQNLLKDYIKALWANKEYEKTIELTQGILEQNEKDFEALLYSATAFEHLDKKEEANNYYKKALELNPKNTLLRGYYSLFLLENFNKKEFQEFVNDSFNSDKNSLLFYYLTQITN